MLDFRSWLLFTEAPSDYTWVEKDPEDYEKEIFLTSNNRQPITKVDYENLIEAEAAIKKLDRNFRKVAKFESRKYVDPINHDRR